MKFDPLKRAREVNQQLGNITSSLETITRNIGKTTKNLPDLEANLKKTLMAVEKGSNSVAGAGNEFGQLAKTLNRKVNSVTAKNTVLPAAILAGSALGASGIKSIISEAQRAAAHSRQRNINEDFFEYKTASAASKKLLMDFLAATIPTFAAGAATLGTDALVKNMYKGKLKAENQRLWERFIAKHPEYANDEEAKSYFRVLLEFNPTSAKHPIVVKNFIDAALSESYHGGASIGINVIGNLTKAESDHFKTKSNELDKNRKTVGGYASMLVEGLLSNSGKKP